jgi:hypothetical protein
MLSGIENPAAQFRGTETTTCGGFIGAAKPSCRRFLEGCDWGSRWQTPVTSWGMRVVPAGEGVHRREHWTGTTQGSDGQRTNPRATLLPEAPSVTNWTRIASPHALLCQQLLGPPKSGNE